MRMSLEHGVLHDRVSVDVGCGSRGCYYCFCRLEGVRGEVVEGRAIMKRLWIC